MNNKPVAWMLVDPNWNDFCRYSSYPTKGAIPLYTHPIKELTDFETNMLRQLQAENDALRKTVDSLFAGLESTTALAKAQAERKT